MIYYLSICIISVILHGGLSLNYEETDLNLLSSNYDAVDDNSDNFDFGQAEFDHISTSLLEKICKNSDRLIYIKQDDITINCQNFMNEENAEEDLNRAKRSADDVDTGSGDGESTTNVDEETTTMSNEEMANEDKKAAEEETTVGEKSTIVEEIATTEVPTEEPAAASTDPQPESPPVVPPAGPQGELPPMVPPTDPQPESPPVVPPVVPPADPQGELPPMVSPTDPQPESLPVVPPVVPMENEAVDAPAEEGESKNTENKETNEEQTEQSDKQDPKKDTEIIKGGRTLIDTPKKQENKQATVQETDDSIQTKESTEEKKAGSKDTTILLVMFVAVVVVGALAFGYNFIKKRRQQSADLERVERNSIKRSLQNLTKPEGGEAEKKPLIGETKEVEMVDMKKQTLVEEKKENGSTEAVVKS